MTNWIYLQEISLSKYSGIDLHLNIYLLAMIDDDKACCQACGSNDLERIVALLEPH